MIIHGYMHIHSLMDKRNYPKSEGGDREEKWDLSKLHYYSSTAQAARRLTQPAAGERDKEIF